MTLVHTWRRAKNGMAPYEPPAPEAEAEELTPELEREPERGVLPVEQPRAQ